MFWIAAEILLDTVVFICWRMESKVEVHSLFCL